MSRIELFRNTLSAKVWCSVVGGALLTVWGGQPVASSPLLVATAYGATAYGATAHGFLFLGLVLIRSLHGWLLFWVSVTTVTRRCDIHGPNCCVKSLRANILQGQSMLASPHMLRTSYLSVQQISSKLLSLEPPPVAKVLSYISVYLVFIGRCLRSTWPSCV